ncbi:Hypothetical predicted protein [Lecanosticta acicola]|uniref:Uncharacterized protein n=1 Tax=Lecanosticta acicola TaxID=111012 RepID=A0AAI8Z723_9PEZI|nr:Hypothetical predicted protein [Lecanosticta acicola]
MSHGADIHSTGRGGAGNIGKDDNVYVDGDIVREGHPGESSAPEYSAGRGGVGNMIHADQTGAPSEEVVPESATRVPGKEYENFHTGRGGEGNVHREKHGGHSSPQKEHAGVQGLVEKAKHAVGLDKKEKTPTPEPEARH